eukprot:jgi/Bigna1/62472/fgenesh1_kg.36_\
MAVSLGRRLESPRTRIPLRWRFQLVEEVAVAEEVVVGSAVEKDQRLMVVLQRVQVSARHLTIGSSCGSGSCPLQSRRYKSSK